MSAVMAAVRSRRGSEAVGLARGYLERGHDPWRLAEALARFVVEDHLTSQQFIERAASVTIAGVDGWEAGGDHPEMALPLLAAVRALSSEARQRWLSRHVRRTLNREGRE